MGFVRSSQLAGIGKSAARSFDRVHADGCRPQGFAGPMRGMTGILEACIDALRLLRGVAVEKPFVVEQHHRGRGERKHDVRLRSLFFRQQFRGDDAGGIPHPNELDFGMCLRKRRRIGGKLVRLCGGVDDQTFSGLVLRRTGGQPGRKGERQQSGLPHECPPSDGASAGPVTTSR